MILDGKHQRCANQWYQEVLKSESGFGGGR